MAIMSSISIQPHAANLHFPAFDIQNRVRASWVLIAWLRTGAGIDHRHTAHALYHWDMSMAEDDKVIRELCEPGQFGATGENILFEWLPGAGVHHEDAGPQGLKCKRDRSRGESGQQFWRKLGLTFAE